MSTSDKNMRFMNRVSLDKFYRNSRNNIEDPLFTGFTFDIDTLNSPLFFALCADEYYESLRSLSGTNIELSKKIEDKLEFAYKYHIAGTPDSYEINTTYSKDMIGDDHRAGYGLQDKYYMDKPVYGAVDYIYMVDKVALGVYTDDVGVTDLGNGTDSNFYRDSNAKLNDLLTDENRFNAYVNALNAKVYEIQSSPDYDPETEDYAELDDFGDKDVIMQKISELETERDKYKDEHTTNVEAYNSAKQEYDTLVGDSSEFVKVTSELNTLQNNVDAASMEVNKTLGDAQSEMSRCLNILTGSTGRNQVKSDVNKAFNTFCSFFGISSSSVSDIINTYQTVKIDYPKNTTGSIKYDVKFSFPTINKIEEEIQNRNVEEDYKSTYEIIFFIQNTKVSEKKADSKVNDDISTLQSKVSKENNKIYGTHSDGRPGTQGNPAEGSVYKKFLDAKNVMENDEYSKIQRQIDEMQAIYDNLEGITEYRTSTYATSSIKQNFPTSDNASGEQSNREIYEVPQTVYDMMGFINGMKDITTMYPYTLQSITGLDEAYKKYFEVKDPYMGSGDDKISIECLEYLDLRVSSMFNKYFNAVYDRQYRRERVPINLRRFNCSVFVHDIRNFKNSLNGGEYPGSGDLKPLVEMALNYVSAIEFKFYDCEIIPEETGGIFEDVTNIPSNEMRKTHFTFKYGNCVINFLPFEDLRKYLLETDLDKIKPPVVDNSISSTSNDSDKFTRYADEGVDDGNFRRWFDKSELGNVNNNDYREYIRHDSSVAVDDHFKTTIVNNFALNSVVNKNQELTAMDDALRKIVTGISASTGIPVKGVTDALNIGFIDPILNEKDLASPVVQKIGNVNNSKVIDEKTMEYIGEAYDKPEQKVKYIDFLGNVNDNKKGGN